MLILSELIGFTDKDFIRKQQENFLAIDTASTGSITLINLLTALQSLDPTTKPSEVSNIFSLLDCDQNGSISYSEWLCALVFCETLTTKNLYKLFKFLDVKR